MWLVIELVRAVGPARVEEVEEDEEVVKEVGGLAEFEELEVGLKEEEANIEEESDNVLEKVATAF